MIECKNKQGSGAIVVLIIICVVLYAIGRGCRSEGKKRAAQSAESSQPAAGNPDAVKTRQAASPSERPGAAVGHVDAKGGGSKTLPEVQRPTSTGSTPREIVQQAEQWLNAVEFEIYSTMDGMCEVGGASDLQSLKAKISAISTELARQDGLAASLDAGKRKLAEQRRVIEAQMKTSESTMRSAYAETLDAVTQLENSLAKVTGRMDVLKTRTARLAASVAEWEEYLAKTTPVIGEDASRAGVQKLVRKASDAWVESSLQGR